MAFADWWLMPGLLGMVGGILLGLAARRGRFCTLGAIEDALYANSFNRIRMWALALAFGIAGTFLLAEVGWVDLGQTLYARLAWNPVASITGGLIFGYGMAIAGNCGYGALARLGGGDLRALVIVVVMGIAAYAVLSGPLASLRVMFFATAEAEPGQALGYAHALSDLFGIGTLWPALIVAGALVFWALVDPEFRANRSQVASGLIVGVAIISGWVGTSLLARHSFEIVPVESHSFTAPVGETMLFMMTGSGDGLSFAIGSVAGVVVGALIGSIYKGQFRWEACDDPQELGRQILGGALMGVGAVLALGCSVGQGLSAFSTLTFSAPIVLASIVLGASLGLRHLIQGFGTV